MNKKLTASLLAFAVIIASGCGSTESSEIAETTKTAQPSEVEVMQTSATAKVSTPISTAQAAELTATVSASEMFTDRDMDAAYDKGSSTKITLSGDSASGDSDAVQISGTMITITDEGTYVFSGTLNDGMITVNAEDTDKVQLVLDGVQITNSTSAAIYAAQADKVFVTTASGSSNTLANGGKYEAVDDNNIDAVIFSKEDLTLNGAGTLSVCASAGHGIVSKDDLVLAGGTYDITSEGHGLSGKDSVRIAGGTYTIDAGKDGIHAENADDTDSGFVYIADGSFEIAADGDGISAAAYLWIDNGDFTIITGDGSASVTMTTDAMAFGQRNAFQTETAATEASDTVSCKGVKSDGSIAIAGGDFSMDTADDSFHAAGDICIKAGEFDIKSGDDAIHSDAAVTIQDGSFTVSYCYEGIEGLSLAIDGGSFDIVAHDDGLNAAGGNDSSGFGGGWTGGDKFSADSNSLITINGGGFTIVSDGDCIDSNGALTINGGTLNLTCNGNGNTALDCNGSFANNGGDITTNDGSESAPGQMGGGMGNHDGGMGMRDPGVEQGGGGMGMRDPGVTEQGGGGMGMRDPGVIEQDGGGDRIRG